MGWSEPALFFSWFFLMSLCGVLQEQELQRLGGTKAIKVAVRLVAATHRDSGWQTVDALTWFRCSGGRPLTAVRHRGRIARDNRRGCHAGQTA